VGAEGGLGSFAMFSTSDREQKGCVFQDDVLVSGLKTTPPACCGRLCLSSPGGRRKANEGPTGVAFLAPKALPRLAQSLHSVPEFQEGAFEHGQRHGKLLGWG
jgi:hypothetical protein